MTSDVTHVAQLDGDVVARLPLNIESVVHRIGQLVGTIIDTQ